MAESTQRSQKTQDAFSRGSALVPSGGNMLASLRNVTAQPGFQRALPTIIAALAVVLGLAAYLYMREPRARRFTPRSPKPTRPMSSRR